MFTPNEPVTTQQRLTIIAAWSVASVAVWEFWRSPIFPSIADIARAFPVLWFQHGLGPSIVSSLIVNVEALLISSAVSLPIAYLSRTPAFEPVAIGLSKLRFLSPSVFFLILLFAASDGHQVKVLMLASGEVFFLVTTMVGVVANIKLDRFDDARTQRMSEWKAIWYVVVRGTAVEAMEAIRDNAAMGWSMLMMVEGFVRSEGGVGVLLLTQEKYLNFAHVYAIAIAIIVVGLAQDLAIGKLRDAFFPYATIGRIRR